VGTDLARRARARPDALTPTLAPRVARSLARFYLAHAFNQPLDKWNTSSVTDMAYMWVLTSPAVRPPAPTRSRPRSLRASLARSLSRFYQATAFNQPIGTWNTGNVKSMIRMLALADAFAQNIHDWKVSQLSCENEVNGYCPCHRFCAGASYLNDNGSNTREKLLPDFPNWEACVRGCRHVGV